MISEIEEKKDRNSHWKCSVRKDVLINFAKFTGKPLRHSLFFNKVAGLTPTILLNRKTGTVLFL